MKKYNIINFVFILFLPVMLQSQTDLLPAWQKGYLDVHFISTGKGNAAFYVLPDATTLLIDLGDLLSSDNEKRADAVPDDSKTPAQWVAEYIYEFHPEGKNAKLDYALITHYHDDHFGHFDHTVKTHSEGEYKLSGITELGSIIPIKKLIDRGSDCPVNFKDPEIRSKMEKESNAFGLLNDLNEYWKFINYQEKVVGLKNEKFIVGSKEQICLLNDASDYPEFYIKNLFANGEISNSWNGEVSIHKFKENEYPGENKLCCGIRITYGEFDLYTGADIPGIDYAGKSDFQEMDALVAPVIGAVDVATLNHHGNRDSQSEYYVRTIRPRVWIGQSWTSNHPGNEVLRRITSPYLYPGERDIFTNFFHPANRTVVSERLMKNYKSTSGHIVVRVYPKGSEYDIFVLNDRSVEKEIMAEYHYSSR